MIPLKKKITVLPVLWSLLLMLSLVVSGCNLFPLVAASAPQHLEQPIVSAYKPYRTIQACLDTPPLLDASYFHEAAVQLADRIGEAVTVNQGGLTIYLSYIEHDSLSTSIMSISVPPIPADPQPPVLAPTPDTSHTDNPYDAAAAQAAVKKENANALATWQKTLVANHALLHKIQAQVKRQTDQIRQLRAPNDVTGADVLGCLDLASRHLSGVNADKSLYIASPLINNETTQKLGALDLAGASVVVAFHTCQIASVCQQNDQAWKSLFKQYHSGPVNFYDPQQSVVLKPTF